MRLIIVALAGVVAAIAHFLNVLYQKRRQMDKLPCPPMKSRFWGHLDIAGELRRVFPDAVHKQHWVPYIQKAYNQPDIFYLDWAPLGPRWLFISDPAITSQYVTTGQSLPKSVLETGYLNQFLGANNMVGLEGQHWKSVRSIFNPGFSANHLMTLVPYIVDASLIFCNAIREKAESNELFPLEESATRLTIDIIGKVVLDSDFHSQKSNHPIVDTFRQRTEFMPRAEAVLDLSWLEYPRRLRLWLNGRKLDKLIGAELDRKMASRATENGTPASSKERKRSVIDLALDAYVKEQATDNKKPTLNTRLDSNFRKNAIDQMKTFIFAGHDTTASTIAYTFYLLHFHPEVHRAMVVELDEVFGSGANTASIAQAIKSEPHLINRLEYITAVIKETLRLFPPASTLRYQPLASDASKDLFMVHPTTGQKLPLSGFHIWPAALLISRNETYFPKPVEFIPERFIPALTPFPEAKLFTPAGKDAWRPFEKGPRGCIGQELAMIESKIILAMTVRDYDFTAEIDGIKIEDITPIETYKEYADGKSGEERMTVEGHRCFQVLKGAAKPRAGMPGRMSLR